LGRFRRDESGASAMIFAIMMIPLTAALGVAIDGARWYHARQQTSAAIDAAVLAGARHMQLNPAEENEAIASAKQHYQASVATRFQVQDDTIAFALVDSRSAMSTTGTATLKTTFLNAVGIPQLPIYTPARAAKATFLGGLNAGTNIEVSLVLDFTGSMCDGGAESCTTGTKLQGLRDAAKELVDIVVNDNQSLYKSRAALVPFSERIRIARNNGDASLMTALTNLPQQWSGYIQDCLRGTGTSSGETASTWTCLELAPPVMKSNLQIMPCVTERIYTNRWDENDTMDYTDDAPGPGRWLMAHGGDRRTQYLDSTDNNPVTTSRGLTAADPAYQWTYADGGWCHNNPDGNVVMPLSADKSALKSAIDGYNAAGGTAGPLATSFGWYMLSPKWDHIWPVDSRPASYADITARNAAGMPVVRKVAVIMTDGLFNMMRGTLMNNTGKLADHTRSVCAGMKAEGIEVYTVGFALDQLGSERSQVESMLKDCGTSVRHFYSTLNVQQLKIAFRDIALKVTPIRLIQ
jgi:Flp pilus assembly protein TadG